MRAAYTKSLLPVTIAGDAVNAFWNAVRFGNGVQLLLQRLDEGQRERVFDLSSADDRTRAL
jgi:hypothetical protein